MKNAGAGLATMAVALAGSGGCVAAEMAGPRHLIYLPAASSSRSRAPGRGTRVSDTTS